VHHRIRIPAAGTLEATVRAMSESFTTPHHALERAETLMDRPESRWITGCRGLSRNAGWPLILLAVALLPFGRLYNIPVIIMASIGLGMLIAGADLRRDRRPAIMGVLFLCLWIPMIASLWGAVQPDRAFRTTLAFLRFPLAGIFILEVLRDPVSLRRLHTGIFVLLLIWCGDALIQWTTGRNLTGQPYDGRFLTGIFHPNRSIGLFIALLLPVYLEHVRRTAMRFPAAWMLALPCPIVILLGGTRTGWVLLILALGLWGIWLWGSSSARGRHRVALLIIAGALASLPLVARIPPVAERIELTREILKGDYESADRALTRRLPIWSIALSIARDHWLTGVGPRGYRYVYAEYADDTTPWVRSDGTGAAHPHLTCLEVAVETGIVGVIGYVLFLIMFLSFCMQRATRSAVPWIICAALAFLPFNTYKAFYSTEWSHISWLLLLVAIALLADDAKRPAGTSA